MTTLSSSSSQQEQYNDNNDESYNENEHNNNRCDLKEFHHLSSWILSFLNATILLIIGIFCFTLPQKTISILWTANNMQQSDALVIVGVVKNITRLLGGILFAQGISCFILLYPFWISLFTRSSTTTTTTTTTPSSCHARKIMSSTIIWNTRIAITIQSITGLCWISVGLVNDLHHVKDSSRNNNNEEQRTTTFSLILIGFIILLLSCISLMFSYWPAADVVVEENDIDDEIRQTSATTSIETRQNNHDDVIENAVNCSNALEELTEPLLQTKDHGDEEQPSNNVEHQEETDAAALEGSSPTSSDDNSSIAVVEPTTTSRIRGTRRLLHLAQSQVIYLYIGCITLLVRLPFSLSIPHFVSTTLGALSQGQYHRAKNEIIWLFVLGTIDACLDFWCIFWFGYANQRIVRGVRIDTFASILKQDVGFFDIHTSGELASRLNSDCGEMAGDLTWFFRFSIESVVRITGITTYMLYRSPKLGACALAIVPVVAIVNKYYGNWLSDNASRVQDALAAANSVAQESLACIRTVIGFASEDFEYSKYVNRINEQYRLNVRQTYMTGIYYMFISTFLINTIVQGTLLLVGTYMIEHGRLSVEVLLAFMLYQGQLQNEMMNLFNSYSSLIKSSGAGDKVFKILDRKPPPPGTGSSQVQSLEGDNVRTEAPISICFDNIYFSYPSRPQQQVLQGINLSIKAGSTIALVGPSGCGKSTIVSLIQRYYDVSAGRLLIDGNDIRSLDLKQHRQRIGVVTQDPTLFTGTILSNITYGMEEISKDEAIEAAVRANAHDFICAMPEGYETEVGERGLKLSGGQKQRIAISRAIIRRPSLLLLDEATSALDADSEEVVQTSIDCLLKQSASITTIIVAHRLRTVRNADIIACIDKGRIIEIGSHQSLMQLEHGYYRGMVEKSMGGKLATD